MAVGKNITLAALNKFTGGISQLMTRQSKMYSGINSSNSKLKRRPRPCYWTFGRRQSAKAILARCLLLNPRILILDEPTRVSILAQNTDLQIN